MVNFALLRRLTCTSSLQRHYMKFRLLIQFSRWEVDISGSPASQSNSDFLPLYNLVLILFLCWQESIITHATL